MVAPQVKRGTVRVEGFRGMLRLRWSFQGDRYGFSMGVPDTEMNRTVAEGKARVIEGDMGTSNFDKTLAKYRPTTTAVTSVTVIDLFQKFQQHKEKTLYKQSLAKYKALHKPLQDFFKNKAASKVEVPTAENFRDYLCKGLAPVTVKERLTTINACWEWGIERKLILSNPWCDVLRSVRVPEKQRPKPFTEPEVQAILKSFKDSPNYNHYSDFVGFLFSTGCRTGEAIGLQWQNLSDDLSTVWIGEAIARSGTRKPTKTNRSRRFKLSPKTVTMLKARHSGQPPEALVFPSPKDRHIDDHNFRNRGHWFRWIGSEKAFWTRDTRISYLAEAVNFSGKKGWMPDSCVQAVLVERLLHNLTAHTTRGFYHSSQRDQCRKTINVNELIDKWC